MSRSLCIIVIGNRANESDNYAVLQCSTNLELRWAANEAECLAQISAGSANPKMLILLSATCEDSLAIFRSIHALYPRISFALVGNHLSRDLTAQAYRAGVETFVRLPIGLDDEMGLIDRLIALCPDDVSTHCTKFQIESLGGETFFLSASPAMRKIHEQIVTIALTDVALLITGESGVGKEVVAKLLHRHSPRSNRVLLKVNCAALPNDLLESELFGYEAGAFTGAMKAKPGKFELCEKGTMLLDEIGEMSPQLQAKLLQVLQDGEFSRLGARGNMKADVRVVAATNINMTEAIAERRFREDLYYRLNAFVVHIPPLRERPQEIPYFLNEFSTRIAAENNLQPVSFSARFIAASTAYPWPGNVRELCNVVKRYVIIRDEAAALTELESKTPYRRTSIQGVEGAQVIAAQPGLKPVMRAMKDEAETHIIREALVQSQWNRRVAADRLQISYKALLYKIRQYELSLPS